MGCLWLLILGLIQNVAHSLEIQGSGAEPTLVVGNNVTAVLGREASLSCSYMGESNIQSAEWKRRVNSKGKIKRLAGFSNGKPFSREDFSNPDSPTNLTVLMRVSSVDAEGEYTCEFVEEEDSVYLSIFVTVVAQPDVEVKVSEEITNNTHFQSVSCAAIGARPPPQIRWLVGGHPPSAYPFTVNLTGTPHPNGTSTLRSVLRFPTHLQDEPSVTCEVQHQTLPNHRRVAVKVHTYAKPNVSIKAEMLQRGGNDFWVVSCISSGGRPDTDISLALNATEGLQRENDTKSGDQRVSFFLPAADYEGSSVGCEFKHPKFPETQSRVITLPSFYLSGVQLKSHTRSNKDELHPELMEGNTDAFFRLEFTGNVPRYNLICRKDDGPLPENVKVIDRNLTFQGPVKLQQAGLYKCVVTYHHLKASLRFNVTVKAKTIELIPPVIRVNLESEDGRRVIKCQAAGAVPTANISWLLPEGVSADSWFKAIAFNGSHSVMGVLLLPACSPQELPVHCIINHPAFDKPENRSLTIPLCARPNISVSVSTEWKDGHKYTKVNCSVVSVASAAAINWLAGNNNNNSISYITETQVQAKPLVSTHSSVHFLSSLYAGHNLTCVVKHPSLESPEKRTINIPMLTEPPQLSVSVVRQPDSPLWLAVCDCRGECDATNLEWALPENARSETTTRTEYQGSIMKARLFYQFPLALLEGQDLTCVYRFENGLTEEKTTQIPRYYISSVRVLNDTARLQSLHDDQTVIYRVSIDGNQQDQKILLRVEGNVPEYSLACQRSDGSDVLVVGSTLNLRSRPAGLNKGLYTCWASFDHHKASVSIQVELLSENDHFMLIVMCSVSSASAVLIFLVVILCVCRKSQKTSPYQGRESISALTSLMQEPSSPDVRKMSDEDFKENNQLVNFSIVFDVRSTV